MLGGTTEEEEYMRLLRAALVLPGQLAQSLVLFAEAFTGPQSHVFLPVRDFLFLIGERPNVFKGKQAGE